MQGTTENNVLKHRKRRNCSFRFAYTFVAIEFLGSYDPYAIIGGVCLSAGIARSSGRNLVGLHDVSF